MREFLQECDQMLIQLPGTEDTDRAKAIIETTALLELKLVDSGPFPSDAAATANYGGSIPSNLELHQLDRRHTTNGVLKPESCLHYRP
jgi:preprotein translocase subunit SecD